MVEVKSSFSKSLRPNFGFHLVFTSFHLEFWSFWVSRLFMTSVTLEGAQGFFSKIAFLKSVDCKEKDEVCLNFLVKFSPNVHRGEVSCYNFKNPHEMSSCFFTAVPDSPQQALNWASFTISSLARLTRLKT